VAKLPPIKDDPRLDLDAEAAYRPQFSLRLLLREYRRPVLLGLVLVVIDAICGLLGPVLIKHGIDNGVMARSSAALFAASGLYLAVTLADLVDQIASTFVTGRTAQRVMLSLRVRIFAQLQRLSLDYYEREMAGRIMTRMTTDVDQFEQLVENGLLAALVSGVTFVGVGVALVTVDATLGLATLTVVIPLAIATVIFRRRSAVLYDLSRERIATASTSAHSISQRGASSSATCRRRRSSSPERFVTTSPTGGRGRTTPRSRRRHARWARTNSSRRCRTGTCTKYRNEGGRCQQDNASSSHWPALNSSTRRSCYSTRPRPTLTSPPRLA
jgi:ABC-type multidrug transport system fused ATPase/permease subunit